MHFYYINRDADSVRRLRMEALIRSEGLFIDRIPGVNGFSVPTELADFFDSRALTEGETGCAASHLLAYAKILALKLPYAIIMEDDIAFGKGMPEDVAKGISLLPEGWDILRLYGPSSDPMQTVGRIDAERRVVRYTKIPRGTCANVVSASGARKLLTPRKILEPIDVEIRWPWQLSLNVFGIDPPLVSHVERTRLPSTIDKRSRPKKFNQLERLVFNIRTMGLSGYIGCRIASFAVRGRSTENAS